MRYIISVNKRASETLRTALALGADKGIHVTTDLRTDQVSLKNIIEIGYTTTSCCKSFQKVC